MVNMSGSEGWPRPRSGNITGAEEEIGGDPKNDQGDLKPTNASSTTDSAAMEDHKNRKHTAIEGDPSSREVGYGCTYNREALAPDHGQISRVTSLDVEASPAPGKDISVEELRGPSPEPPVTKATLSELDVPRIVYNPKLRHDVNFDPDLHFRPNLDGESGRKKAQKANDFWNRLRTQLDAFMADPVGFEREIGGQEWCLQSTLQAIGEILGTLVPPEDRSVVEEILNVELLMQQFRRGVADLEKLALWLAGALKSHCAPMRDEWVDEMVTHLTVGNRDRNVDSLVQGLQSLLGVLEAMKLDVANHQIRCLRPLLIQDTVEFEQTFFMKKIALRKIDIAGAYAWFQASKPSLNNTQSQSDSSQGDMWVFFNGFMDLLLPSRMGAKMPDTFTFDEERIIKIRADILDAINLDICIFLLDDIQYNDHSQETQSTDTSSALSKTNLVPTSHSSGSVSCNSTTTLRQHATVSTLQREIKTSKFPKAKRTINKQPELPSRHILVIEPESGDDDDSGTVSHVSSRRTSVSSNSSESVTFPLSPSQSEATCSAPIDVKLRQSILAIVDDAPGNNKWQQSCADIALQLLRSHHTLKDLSRLDSQLQLHLSNPMSLVFRKSESRILAEFNPLFSAVATRYASLTATQLFEVATSPRPLPYQVRVPRHALSDVAKQMAHIGILHWRVWAQLAYLVNPDDAGHVTSTEPEPRKADHAWGLEEESNRRRSPQRQNSISESIPTGG